MDKLKGLLLTTILTCLVDFIIAQDIKITVDNSEPRLGQEIVIKFETNFIDDFLKSEIKDSLELTEKSHHDCDLTKAFIVKRVGQMTIGPFKLDFNGKTYWTNSISINVIEGLTDKEGVCVRKVKINDKDYIVIEQIINLTPKTSKSGNTWNTEWETTEKDIAELNQPDNDDLEFFESSSGRGGHPDKLKKYPSSISYCYRFYEIKKGTDFKGNYKLKEKDFSKLPKGTKIPDIIID